jgi:hypothetical protein
MTTLPAVADTPPAKRSPVHISRCQTIVGSVCRLQRMLHAVEMAAANPDPADKHGGAK